MQGSTDVFTNTARCRAIYGQKSVDGYRPTGIWDSFDSIISRLVRGPFLKVLVFQRPSILSHLDRERFDFRAVHFNRPSSSTSIDRPLCFRPSDLASLITVCVYDENEYFMFKNPMMICYERTIKVPY